MASGDTIILPSGTEQTQLIPMPISGGWLGLVRVRITSSADATIHQWLFIYPWKPDSKVRYRRVGTSTANNFYNSPLKANQELGWWMMNNESLFKITYTSTKPISVIWESTQDMGAVAYPNIPATQWNKQADAKPWVTNLTPGNSTESPVYRPWLDGVSYWVPK